ncbi:hypothetical protein [Paraburkholderia sp. HP33-1]|uniref:hypothetical protein n=1 Tax=Paraburkholderia sp. HP33-1 TaxID=2883243 RepID=UPI001F2DE01D|nr:hypothetical protein [Paraburkholderia sp. HP33-1]
MAIDVKDNIYQLGSIETYVIVDGVKYAIVRADAWFDEIGSRDAPASRGKSLLIPVGDVIMGGRKSYGVKTVNLALNPAHPAHYAAVHSATYYPAHQVTFAAASRRTPRLGSSMDSKRKCATSCRLSFQTRLCANCACDLRPR